jgi:hypothetical protein
MPVVQRGRGAPLGSIIDAGQCRRVRFGMGVAHPHARRTGFPERARVPARCGAL